MDNIGIDRAARLRTGRIDEVAYDQGLRTYMLKVYNLMMLGLVLSGAVAFAAFNLLFADAGGGRVVPTELGAGLYGSSWFFWFQLAALIGFPVALSFGIHRLRISTAILLFVGYCVSIGFVLTSILAMYQPMSIANSFFITAATFGALSLYGYTTRKNLSALGSFLFIGLIGSFAAIILNLFIQNTVLELVINVVMVLVFAGLTAYDTQKIKEGYYQLNGSVDLYQRSALYGAFTLYVDFIALFLRMVYFFGVARGE